MNFQNSVKSGFDNFAVFEGRSTRSEFWWWYLFYMVSYITAIVIDTMTGLGFVTILVALALMCPSIAITTRRLHDVNKSGWWQLISLIPILGLIVMIVLTVKKGDETENRFGPPKA